ncbi:MAG: FAD-binding oxidoreductase [Bacteroidales bacterium]|jgi:ferredoxin--NADP+ reductase/benzoate/toluate 1,2-dioxygenase reductase subunit|nr:FAD-binding oxidoreductase [Bacteroidales bacterium]
MQTNGKHRLRDVKFLTESTYILQMDRNGLEFEAGQHILLGADGDLNQREYSIYSGNNEEFLEVLIKEVDDGDVSIKLKDIQPGNYLQVEGPLGFFSLDEKLIPNHKFLFVSSGTGISPFHCMVKSHPELDYTLLHGVRYGKEGYESHHYDKNRYIKCTSGDQTGDFAGRVTDYLLKHPIDKSTICYFCGNFKMIREAMDILDKKGIPHNQLHAEVYF